ncbi:glycoside hydrolase/phage tail family protein [Methylobacterium durans]|uniref:baseplate multidomain protein megatron n=1 Tax=Methylobacterium durans TaxID=2202825 RepID=UPI002AFE971A|nr:glycoside hydrolase/phage tail family protein [Methylobacterium durans]MEA1834033.1 glycoside hydrolase/phage tail family protein [Methylobacterium durans]
MATLILSTAGAALGTALGGPVGGLIGRVAGAAAGAAIDGALFGPGSAARQVEGPRLTDLAGLSSTEGDPVPRVYGRARIGGTLIWATRPLEVATKTVERGGSGAKGGGGGKTVRTTYAYYANLAVGLCEGEIALVRRVWANGQEIDLTTLTHRVHTGRTDQAPDPLIVAKEGPESAPAYRGLAYVVFERMPLSDYGNRIPQLAFEVVRPVAGLGRMIRAVNLIPGATESGLDPHPVTEDFGLGASRAANRVQLQAATDVLASLDALQALCPRLEQVSVVVSWFGDDLRAGRCTVAPRVEDGAKRSLGADWSVAGLARSAARTVSRGPDGAPAYGGTPSDAGLGRLVAELSQRGLKVVLYPFLMMDVPAGNALPDPRDRSAGRQPAYPWRGRITCDPAPGVAGSPDGTAAAGAQVAAFFEGPSGYRRMVLHYADLAAFWAAAGLRLSGFILGSELVGLTRVRSEGGRYPAVEALRDLARAVRQRLPETALVYAADWTEYGADVRDGGASVRFPLDALFADASIDAVGIDYYPPLSDWRDGPGHADLAEAPEIYDRAYLRRRLGAGEAFDWYYASEAARQAQARTPITDGAAGKPWIHRAKDLVAWWSNPHVERDGGVETRTTAWQPRSKPIWLTEIGVPAVDKGTNGPNVFPDPKSAENAAPPLSRGSRDDLIQLRGLEAILGRFDPAVPGFDRAHNPVSPVYGGPMVPPGAVFVWAWDARPFPAFPDFSGLWADAPHWGLGHWITGRVEGLDLDRLIPAILADLGVAAPLDIAASAYLDGYVIDRPLSARAALEPLAQLYGLDVSTVAGTLRVRGPRREAAEPIPADDLVRSGDEAPFARVRAEDGALPARIEIGFTDAESPEYRRAAAAAARGSAGRTREIRLEAAIVTRRAEAEALAEGLLDAGLAARDTAAFRLSPHRLALEPGDLVALPETAAPHRILRIDDGPAGRRIETRAVPLHRTGTPPTRPAPVRPSPPPPALPGPPLALVLDLPADRGEPTVLQSLAVAATPWPGAVAVWRAEGPGAPLALRGIVDYPACLGRTLTPLPPGPLWRFDRGARLDAAFRPGATLSAVDDRAALSGQNLFALIAPDGTVEILSAAGAELTGPDTWRLSRLLRGLSGSEAAAERTTPVGSWLVRLDDGAPVPLVDRLDEAGRSFRYRIGPAARDPGDAAFTEIVASAGLSALRPLSPVGLRARREAGGVRFRWIRRARRTADAWEPVEIPLDEAAERYRLDIHAADGRLLRSLTAAQPSLLYPGTDEAADFGFPQREIEAAVAQVGAVAGIGAPLRTRVAVRAG